MRKSGLLVCGFLGALLLSQFPEFFQQYTQRLGGRLDELTTQVSALEERAAASGKDLTGYLRVFLLHRDVDVRREGQELRAMVQRRAALAESYRSLTGVDRWWRAAAFAENVDWQTARATIEVYRPAMPVTPEAGIYAGAGFGTGAAIFLAILGLWGPERRRSRNAPPSRRG
jgi:hypothetical protein